MFSCATLLSNITVAILPPHGGKSPSKAHWPMRCRGGSRDVAGRICNGMPNIPTELLRTFVAVVDLRGFTKAAQALGFTQPAVSAQIKRLQSLLGRGLLDKTD